MRVSIREKLNGIFGRERIAKGGFPIHSACERRERPAEDRMVREEAIDYFPCVRSPLKNP